MTVNVLLEDAFDGHQGNDLYDPDRASYRVFRVRKQASLQELMDIFSESFKYPQDQIRPWPLSARSNQVNNSKNMYCYTICFVFKFFVFDYFLDM